MFKRIFMLFLLLFVFLLPFNSNSTEKIVLKVFHAGSLSVPFAAMEKAFEKQYPYIDVRREASGSVKAVRKVIDLHKPCDVIAVADYTLIPKMMFPKYADYVKLFAQNELVLCYTPHSRYSQEINSQNWYQILARPDVKWGFSNPNDDPCGYRTVIAIVLASLYYHKPDLMQELLSPYVNLSWQKSKEGLVFTSPSNLKTKGHKIFIRPKSVELLGLLESNAIDYAFEYKSVALQHKLLFVSLPSAVNLSQVKHASFYKQVKIKLANGKIISGKPIVYGIATLKTAPHLKEAKLWEEFITGEEGQRILKNCFQTPIFPPKEIKAK